MWTRALYITPSKREKALESAFGKCVWKKLREQNGLTLYVAESRGRPDYDPQSTLVIGIDDRGPGWFIFGDPQLAAAFNARIELTVGFEIESKDYPKLKNYKPFTAAVKQLEEVAGELEFDEDQDRFGARIDVELGERAEQAVAALEKLAAALAQKGVDHRVAVFRGQTGEMLGELDESDQYLGPDAIVCASWDVQVMRTETVEVVLNESESLLDGETIEGL
jgi:hypothetical protein